MRLAWQVFSVLVLHLLGFCSACSVYCHCKWKNGKQTVECTEKGLLEIPDGMDAETQVLDFSGNTLGNLAKELFLKKQLINLQRIYLSNCKIRNVYRESLKGLTNLVELDLSHNLLDAVPSAAFLDCPSLMKLTLSHNPISSLKKFAFNHLSYLNTLELSNCDIADIEIGAFQGLHSLEWLRLDGNSLKNIKGRNTIPENIKGVDLQKNPWECDCNIGDLHAWLNDFNIPLSLEPICKGPPRLSGRTVRSVAFQDLACLPDITPTSFYLELGEGKNVSLLCHVHAVPEATVSWWFQGQILQNNTAIAPGVHLVYYLEEGTETKRSELFIYNANAEDNGTFICSAENAAGIAQSNFTIKIVLKEDPVVIVVSLPFEYLVYAASGVAALLVIVCFVTVVLAVRCRRRRKRREKRLQSKENALSLPQNNTSKISENIEIVQLPKPGEENILLYQQNELLGTVDESANRVTSPIPLTNFQIEQNPDIINGTESIAARREVGDGEDGKTVPENVEGVACIRATSHFYADTDGYPLDYGLPKLQARPVCNEAYYRTLPCNRLKRHSAANPIKRYSREVEFLSRSVDSPYDHYHPTNVRYTADGYPVPIAPPTAHEAPPRAHEAGPRLHEAGPRLHEAGPTSLPPCYPVKWAAVAGVGVTKRCASAQTDTEDDSDGAERSKAEGGAQVEGNEALTESPDEGYEGEPSVV